MYTTLKDNKLLCELCSHHCIIDEGRSGFCRARENIHTSLHLPFYGLLSGTGIDPIEKKPLYHYRPGTKVFSVGYWGCNLRCPFCQNWQISQQDPGHRTGMVTADSLISQIQNANLDSVCHTYSEPSIHIEYLLECAEKARELEMRSLLVTNGNLEPKPARDLYGKMAAVNIDLKSMNEEYYRRILRGDLNTVLNNIRTAVELSHVEVTSLIVPGNNDSVSEIRKAAVFLRRVEDETGKSIPFHLSRYFPNFKEQTDPPEVLLLKELQHEAQKHISYVYLGNVDEVSETRCRECGFLLIIRHGYKTQNTFAVKNNKVICPNCQACQPITL